MKKTNKIIRVIILGLLINFSYANDININKSAEIFIREILKKPKGVINKDDLVKMSKVKKGCPRKIR